MKKLLAIGISDFKELIDQGYYYIDKTLLIDEIRRTSAHVILIPRPRRFGKTLNLSMLRYFHEKSESNNSYLFENTAIWKSEKARKTQGAYPVIYLSFKDCKKESWKSAYDQLKFLITEEFRRHADYLMPLLNTYDLHDYKAIVNQTASQTAYENSLFVLTKLLKKYYKRKVLVLIDEYDTPIHAGYVNGYYKESANFLRALFGAVLKDNPYLKKGILTGILRAAKEGIFSGLNNLRICSFLDKRFADKFGFTNAEVDALLGDYKIATKAENIKDWYNGYRCGNLKVYNPWSLLECVDHQGELRTYWANTSDNMIIQKLIPLVDDESKYDLEKLLRGETITREINEALVFPGIEKDPTAVWSLLFFAGYLTFTKRTIKDGATICNLALPNHEVKILYQKLIKSLLEESLEKRKLAMFMTSLENGNIEELTLLLHDFIVTSISAFDIPESETEKSYHLFMLGLFVALSDIYEVKSNRESGYGRYDIMLIPLNKKKPGIIIEFKKVSRILKETLVTASEKAMRQIIEKNYAHELTTRGMESIIAYGIAFEGKKLAIKHEWLKQA